MIYVYVGSDSAYLKLQIRRKYIQTKVALEDTEFLSFSGYEDLIQDVVEDVRSPSFTANKKIIVMDKCYFSFEYKRTYSQRQRTIIAGFKGLYFRSRSSQ